MIYLGIDIAKTNHFGAFIDDLGESIGKPFKFTNDQEGFNILISHITNLETNPNNILIAMEATGHYWLALYTALTDKNYNVSVYNPFQIKGFRPAYSVRKVKNDRIDAKIIAHYLRVFGSINSSLPKDDLLSLKQITRFRKNQIDQIASLKTQVIGILDKIFPEYALLFSNIFGEASKQLLLLAPTPDEILKLDFNELVELLELHSKKRLGTTKAKEIKNAAEKTFGIKITLNACVFEVKQLINQIIFLEEQLDQIDYKIEELYDSIDCHLQSIPGVGKVTLAIIVAEIGDINKFDSPKKLISFAGIDPSEKQSGNFKSTDDKSSKRGSPYLRYAINQAAFTAMTNIPEFREYYLKKKSEGKHHKVALAGISRRLLTIIYYILKENRDYKPY